MPEYKGVVKISLYTESNSWQLATGNEKELSRGILCNMTNSLKSDSECVECSDKTLYQGGLSFLFGSSQVVPEQNDVVFKQNGSSQVVLEQNEVVFKQNDQLVKIHTCIKFQ